MGLPSERRESSEHEACRPRSGSDTLLLSRFRRRVLMVVLCGGGMILLSAAGGYLKRPPLVTGTVSAPWRKPNYFHGDRVSVYRLKDEGMAIRARGVITNARACSNNPEVWTNKRLRAMPLSIETHAKVAGKRFSVRVTPGIKLITLMGKGYGWFIVKDVTSSMELVLDESNGLLAGRGAWLFGGEEVVHDGACE